MITMFLAHKSPGKGRIFALVRQDRGHRLEAVTSLAGADLHSLDGLVDGLNEFLYERSDADLDEVLTPLPTAVRMSVKKFVADRCPYELGEFTDLGFNGVVRERVAFSPDPGDAEELIEYLEGAFTIGLGVRMGNSLDSHGLGKVAVCSDRSGIESDAP